jgi:hypothetical protein
MAVMVVVAHSSAYAASKKKYIHFTTITGYGIFDFLNHGRPGVRAITHL